MLNPITESLGYTVPYRRGYRTVITITARSFTLLGTAYDEERREFEGFYRVGPSGQRYGACISVGSGLHTITREGALRVLAAAIIGPNPRPGQVAKLAETLPASCKVTFSFKARSFEARE